MSEPISALDRAAFAGIAQIEECGLQGMITLRGDLADTGLAGAVGAATGAGMPGQREIVFAGDNAVAWMSPDELLLLVPHAEAEARVAALSQALSGSFAMAVNVSDARAIFRVSGPSAREVIGKLAPVDLSQAAFPPGRIRRTRLAQVAAAIWADDAGTLRLICFRSTADYVFKLLKVAAQPGSEVGFY